MSYFVPPSTNYLTEQPTSCTLYVELIYNKFISTVLDAELCK